MAKLLFLAVVFPIVIPVCIMFIKAVPKARLYFFVAMLYMISMNIANVTVFSFFPEPDWTGTARGYTITVVDILALIVVGSMLFMEDYRFSFFPRGWWLYGLYFMFGLFSGINAELPLHWSFEVERMIFMYIFFLASYNFITYHRDLRPVIYTISVSLFIMFVVGVYQKYLGGKFQISSTMPHQNSMGLFCIMYSSILLGALFNEPLRPRDYAIMFPGLIGGAALLVFSLSRGGMVCFVMAIMIVLVLSLIYGGMSRRKVALVVVMSLAVILPAIKAAPQLIRRFENAPEASKITRINLALCATRIAHDHFLGIGLNNFALYSGWGSPYAPEQFANFRATDSTRNTGGVVETIYLLVAAECGWGGLAALLGWFFYYFRMALLNVLYLKYRRCFGISIGIFAGMTSNFIHSTLEWSLKQHSNFYQLMFVFALTATIYVTNVTRRSAEKREYEAKLRQRLEAAKPWHKRPSAGRR
ncbi:MAG: O-antigen ligase family protein [Victivallaceae bacterium]|nr:hypothetical protein [Victivallaceae bacterium]